MVRSFLRKWIKEKVYYKYLNRVGHFRYFNQELFFPKGSLSFVQVFKNGVYEWDNLRFVLGNIPDNSTYFDVGANLGLMSLPILDQTRNVNVIALEASPQMFMYLQKTRERSKYKDKWILINKAVSDSPGLEMNFHLASPGNHAYGSLQDTARIKFTDIIKVTTTTIDEIWRRSNKPKVSFIKTDIEGADLLALRGAAACIKECKPAILIEWHGINIAPFGFVNSDLLDECVTMKYNCYAIPAFNHVKSEIELRQNMLLTESYLLLPQIDQ